MKLNWSNRCQKAFDHTKKISDLLLAHFDPEVKIAVAFDTSEYGIKAVMLNKYQNDNTKAVIHASCFLTAIEKNCTEIHKKAQQSSSHEKNFTSFCMVEVFNYIKVTDHYYQFLVQKKEFLLLQQIGYNVGV